MTLFFGVGTIIVGLFLMFLVRDNPENFKAYTDFTVTFGVGGASMGGFMLVLTKLPMSIGRIIFGDGVRDFEFNRRTGRVTRWKYIPLTGIKRRTISKPFSEFVPYLQNIVTGAGTSAGWNLLMMHKDSRRFSVGSSGLINPISRGDAMAFWDFIQCYMDISQPLPETPILEAYRQQDPVTREHDKRTQRPERYWRDMSAAEMQQKAFEMSNRITLLAAGEAV